jgi:hypothetical protein
MSVSLVKQPSGVAPIVMSVVALGLVLGHVAVSGLGREADEGAAAHLFQILMAGQLPVMGYFALKWLPRAPGPALRVLVLQLVAAGLAFAALYWLEHAR